MVIPPVPVSRSRILWGGVCWVITFVLLVFGVGYLTFGSHATSLPAAYTVFIRYVPGHLHTYGGILLAFALWMLYGLAAPIYGEPMRDDAIHNALLGVIGLTLLIVWMFAWSWALTGTQTWQAVAYWLSIGALAVLAARYAPSESDDGPGRAQ